MPSNTNEIENPYRVRLVSAANRNEKISFVASPVVTESIDVNYEEYDPIHAPSSMQVFKNTPSRKISISDIKLISRTVKEADQNLETLWLLRSWTTPRFGNSSTVDSQQRFARIARAEGFQFSEFNNERERRAYFGKEINGAPPPILYFSAYSRDLGNMEAGNAWKMTQHFNKVPVVIRNLSIPYPNDVDYITTSTGVPMPTIISIDMSLAVTHSPKGLSNFNLYLYKKGRLEGY